MQFQVPQNITMEDRIVWFLSPLQFGIVVIGGGLSFVIFTSSLIPAPVNQGLGGLFALLTVIIAVGKFNDQPMYRFIRFIVAFVVRPRVRVWHKEGGEIQLVKPKPLEDKESHAARHKRVSHADISQLAAVLDTRGTSGIIPKVNDPKSP